MTKRIASYGAWDSPIKAEAAAAGSLRLGHLGLDGEAIYWIETRPAEMGRNAIVGHGPDGQTVDAIPPSFNACTRVHEYGGSDFAVVDGVLYFSNMADQRLYRQSPGGVPQALTPASAMRYADGVLDSRRQRLICVREDHSAAGQEAINTLVSLALDGSDGVGRVLAAGADFYASPCLSPDGTRLAYLTWNHPNMPWDSTELWLAKLSTDGAPGQAYKIAGGPDESIFQPAWSPDGVLHFVSDRTGWWNLYRWREGELEALYAMEADFGQPQWVFGHASYGFESPTCLVCSYVEKGTWRLARLDLAAHSLEPLDIPYTEMSKLRMGPGWLVMIAGSPTQASSVVRYDLDRRQVEVLRRSNNLALDEGYLSYPQAIEFPTENGLAAHAFFYSPRNADYAAPAGDRPPLLVMSHGGPTSAASTTLDPAIQYWTSRGIAVLDVNYGGSTGYGRAYRQRLKEQWGIVDVDDCVNGARYLVERGEVDGSRLAIRGGSAGGYTTLAALTFREVFKAGASYYGVSDLEALARETHKFESRYLDGLVGPYPQRRDLYLARSPIHHTARLSTPMILLQGLEDPVVPPAQAQKMFEAVRAKGLPVAYVPFAGEQHGFRRAENIKRALEAELYFFARIFGFEPADEIEAVHIENLS
ncbi:MAG: S9 family peptidase [Thermoflexales bacterium]|nr:S9 family peptidase [Thermoflexales bacterium]